MVQEDRSYQTQYFAKIFPSSLTSTLHIHFYFHLKESSSAPKSTLQTRFFMLFFKNLTKNVGKKLMIVFVLIE